MHRRAPVTFALINILIIQTTGTVLFHFLEKWSYIDSFYYTGMLITTIGTYDPFPHNSLTKIFAVIFAFYAITLFLYCLGVMRPSIDEWLTRVFDKVIFWRKIG